MPALLFLSWSGNNSSNLCAQTRLTIHVKYAAKGLHSLPHTRHTQRPCLAILLLVWHETLTIIGNNNFELIRPIRCESDCDFLRAGVLANIGQGFLNEPEDLKCCGR